MRDISLFDLKTMALTYPDAGWCAIQIEVCPRYDGTDILPVASAASEPLLCMNHSPCLTGASSGKSIKYPGVSFLGSCRAVESFSNSAGSAAIFSDTGGSSTGFVLP